MKKKNTSSKREAKPIETNMDIHFCTECQEDLEDYSTSGIHKNLKEAIKNHENCKKIGKYNGEMCSKIFILSEKNIEINNNDDEDL